MKKAISILMCIALVVLLTACGNEDESQDGQTPLQLEETQTETVTEELPDIIDNPAPYTVTDEGEAIVDQTAEQTAEPTQAPAFDEETAQEAETEESDEESGEESGEENASADYELVMVTDDAYGFVYAYPSTWKMLPGKYTLCFREQVEDGQFPARVAVTYKSYAHEPKQEKVQTEFQSYANYICGEMYPSETFEWGDLNQEDRFMDHLAYSITYLAYSGDVEVKGYLCVTSVGKKIYLFHFCCPFDDYDALSSMMKKIKESVTIPSDDEE